MWHKPSSTRGSPSSRSWYTPRQWAQGGPYDSNINGVAEEMTGVGNDLMSPASGNEAAKATHMEELGCLCGGSARVGLGRFGAWVPQTK
jgi:hypothetical protein